MNKVAPIVLALVLVLIAGLGIYYFRSDAVQFVRINILPNCSTPLTYTVGTIDPKFGLTKEEVVAKLGSAAALWNRAAGKTVLVYDPADAHAMPVNFIYDTRQQTITVGSAIDSTEASQEQDRKQIEALQAKHKTAQIAYASAVDELNRESDAYSKEVREVNARGGADQATYDRLNVEKVSLETKRRALEAKGTVLQAEGQELTALIAVYNKKVGAINQIVEDFNATAGGDFEEGQYVQDAHGKRIDIYAYKNQAELLHSLAHEFGHALSLPHNENSQSIMFPYNKSGVALSVDDLAALKTACHL